MVKKLKKQLVGIYLDLELLKLDLVLDLVLDLELNRLHFILLPLPFSFPLHMEPKLLPSQLDLDLGMPEQRAMDLKMEGLSGDFISTDAGLYAFERIGLGSNRRPSRSTASVSNPVYAASTSVAFPACSFATNGSAFFFAS